MIAARVGCGGRFAGCRVRESLNERKKCKLLEIFVILSRNELSVYAGIKIEAGRLVLSLGRLVYVRLCKEIYLGKKLLIT